MQKRRPFCINIQSRVKVFHHFRHGYGTDGAMSFTMPATAPTRQEAALPLTATTGRPAPDARDKAIIFTIF